MFNAIIALAAVAAAQTADTPARPTPGLTELRYVHGEWDVRTELLNSDGSVARSVEGTYKFSWAIPDAVLHGLARQPQLNSSSALLLYRRPATQEVEMVAVDEQGTRWFMTGKDGSDIRSTEDRKMSDGSTMRLRFTRYGVEPNRFWSKMEYSTDSGKTWAQGNRQRFDRRSKLAPATAPTAAESSHI